MCMCSTHFVTATKQSDCCIIVKMIVVMVMMILQCSILVY